MKKLSVYLIALILIISLAACGESAYVNPEFPAASNEASKSIGALSTISAEDYQNLNKFFDPFTMTARIESIKSEFDVVEACAIVADLKFEFDFEAVTNWDEEIYAIPKENIEQLAKRYFDVDSINHENFGKQYRDKYRDDDRTAGLDGYRNGYYALMGPADWYFQTWYNVSSLTNNFDGTYTAEINAYSTYSDIRNIIDSMYDKAADWKLAPNQKIIDIDGLYNFPDHDDVNIFKSPTNTVILQSYGDSWQIIKINDFAIPKHLL